MNAENVRRVAIGTWAPEYGTPLAADPDQATPADVDPDIELPGQRWAPVGTGSSAASVVRFVDGVRRIDSRLWVQDADGVDHPGIAACCAAGVACCDGAATIESCEVRRTAITGHPDAPDIPAPGFGTYAGRCVSDATEAGLSGALQDVMATLEQLVVGQATDSDLVVVDGPLRTRPLHQRTVGYIKTHHTAYLSGPCAAVVGRLAPGERTPLFRISSGRWTKLSWYLRLPGRVDHPWEAVARCEVFGDGRIESAARLAELTAATLPRFASTRYKDPRAPQNLHPIAALERQLRHRLGDPALAVRALRRGALSV
jgi:hypothetical protein